MTLHRRHLLAGGLSLGLAAQLPGLAHADTRLSGRKLVIVILRGGMDGLSLCVPYADPNYSRLRGEIALKAPGEVGGVLKLDDHFGLSPAMPTLHGLLLSGEARLAPASAIPVRQRSHFEAQDILESGSAKTYDQTDGWLNRSLPLLNAKGLAVGAQAPLVMRGKAPFASYVPAGGANPSAHLISLLTDLYAYDAKLAQGLAMGLSEEQLAKKALEGDTIKRDSPEDVGRATAKLMTAEGGADVVGLSLDGFDTHAGQGVADGLLAGKLKTIDQLLTGLKAGLGPSWANTLVVMSTEFGRTMRINGTKGTDHGTASTAILAGGGLKRGKFWMLGDWPGLEDKDLFENRDLAPSLDVRSLYKTALCEHLGLSLKTVEAKVFSDSVNAPILQGLI